MKVVLIGFAASYKTTVGSLIAKQLQCSFWDVDSLVEEVAHSTVSEIFAQQGEKAFRKMENDVLKKLSDVRGVISCGGGSVLAKNFPSFAKNGKVVWLKTSANSVKQRLTVGTRPLFDNLSAEQLAQQVEQREKLYRNFADVCIVTDDKTSQQVADETLQFLQLR